MVQPPFSCQCSLSNVAMLNSKYAKCYLFTSLLLLYKTNFEAKCELQEPNVIMPKHEINQDDVYQGIFHLSVLHCKYSWVLISRKYIHKMNISSVKRTKVMWCGPWRWNNILTTLKYSHLCLDINNANGGFVTAKEKNTATWNLKV